MDDQVVLRVVMATHTDLVSLIFEEFPFPCKCSEAVFVSLLEISIAVSSAKVAVVVSGLQDTTLHTGNKVWSQDATLRHHSVVRLEVSTGVFIFYKEVSICNVLH